MDIVVTVTSFQFSPNSFSVNSGDKISFLFVNPGHTATSSTVPNGASTFDFVDTNGDIFPTVTGFYRFHCTPHANFMFGTFTVGGVTGIFNNNTIYNSSEEISHFPSPANDNLYIKFPKSAKSNDYKILIFNIEGKEVLQTTNTEAICKSNKGSKCTCGSSYDISNLLSGIYYLKIFKDNELVYSKSFLKE